MYIDPGTLLTRNDTVAINWSPSGSPEPTSEKVAFTSPGTSVFTELMEVPAALDHTRIGSLRT